MKKTFLILIFLISIMAVSVTASAQISVYVDDNPVVSDVAPTMVSDRVLLPVRAVFEALDAEVNYIHEENKVVAVRRDKVVEHIIGTNTMTVNGEVKTFDVPSMLTNGRTLVPLRACAEAFDLEVNWDEATQRVDVKSAYRLDLDYLESYFHNIEPEYDSYKGRELWEGTKYEYNEKNQKVKEITYSSCTYFIYDDEGKLKYMYTDDDSINSVGEYKYDNDGRLIYAPDENGDKFYGTTYEYDDKGRLVRKSSPTEDDPPVFVIEYSYDENDRIACEKRDGRTLYYEYDEKGNLIKKTNENGAGSYYTYDGNGKLICKKEGVDWLVEGEIVFMDIWEYEYDEQGRLVFEKFVNPLFEGE